MEDEEGVGTLGVYIYIDIYLKSSPSIFICMYVYVCMYIYIFMYACMHMYIFMYSCLYVCVYIYHRVLGVVVEEEEGVGTLGIGVALDVVGEGCHKRNHV